MILERIKVQGEGLGSKEASPASSKPSSSLNALSVNL
jgi:hypothetical protein